MDSLIYAIIAELGDSLSKSATAAGFPTEDAANTIEASKAFGDLSSTLALKLAKQTKGNPIKIYQLIVAEMTRPEYIENITGENGFINFHFKKNSFMNLLLNHVVLEKTLPLIPPDLKVVVESPSVNPNKPWHIGHLRSALLGDCMANIYETLGYVVERQNYIDDLGLQVAEILWWYQKNSIAVPEGKKFDEWLGEEYVKVNAYMKEHGAEAKEGIGGVQARMEQDGTYESKLARDMVSRCVAAQYQTAFAFNIYHNLLVWEGDIVRVGLLDKALAMLKEHGFAKLETEDEYKGCIIINLKEAAAGEKGFEGLSSTSKVLVRSNGTATYLAKDIAFHMWKFGLMGEGFKYSLFMERQPNGKPLYTTSQEGANMKFGAADVAINTIDVRQSQPQAILKMAFSSIGKEKVASGIRHIAFGEVELESGSLSGRSGNWIGYSADDILKEAISKAKNLISSRFEFSEEEKTKVSVAVALAAIKFEFLKYGVEKKIVFSWEKALNFEGGSGPYHQYMHARANRILSDAKDNWKNASATNVNAYEFELAKVCAMSNDIIKKAQAEGRPSVITDYLNTLSSTFSKFYENCPVLKANEDTRALRLALTEMFRDTSAIMLRILGIEPLARM